MGFNKLPCAVLLSLGLMLSPLVAVGFERAWTSPIWYQANNTN